MPTGGQLYYVDSVAGNDANAGTSRSVPWKSLSKASAAVLTPGDRLLFKRGGTWTGTLALDENGTSASQIAIGAYGFGSLPVISGGCIELTGSYVIVQDLHVNNCSWAGIDIRGSSNRVERCLITHNVAGVFVRSGATGNRILNSQIKDNNRMSVSTPDGSDDSGAFGILLHGDDTEVAYNTISGSDAFSHDYGRDGAAIEIYGGRSNFIHNNLAVNNNAFAELGNSRSADNTFAYNVVRSSLSNAIGIVTRGQGSDYGPVVGTRLFNNTVVLTGSSSQGFVCQVGCGPDILTMRNNIIQAVAKVGYVDQAFDEDYNLFFGGQRQFTKGSHSVVASPSFVDAANGNFALTADGAAIDCGTDVGYTRDFNGAAVPIDGNGDGRAVPDCGAYEYQGRTLSVRTGTDGRVACQGRYLQDLATW